MDIEKNFVTDNLFLLVLYLYLLHTWITSLYEKLNWQAEDERICLTAEIRYFHRYAAVL